MVPLNPVMSWLMVNIWHFIFSIYLVPERNLILSANKAIHKISREECIAIIKQFNFALEPTLYIFIIFAIFYFYISFAI